MGKFKVSAGRYADRTIKYDLYVEGVDDPVTVHLRYSGPENKAFQRRVRAASAKYRRQGPRGQEAQLDNFRRQMRGLFPGDIIVRVINAPLESGGVSTLDKAEDIAEFVNDLAESYFDELLEASATLANFGDAGDLVTVQEAQEVAAELGEG